MIILEEILFGRNVRFCGVLRSAGVYLTLELEIKTESKSSIPPITRRHGPSAAVGGGSRLRRGARRTAVSRSSSLTPNKKRGKHSSKNKSLKCRLNIMKKGGMNFSIIFYLVLLLFARPFMDSFIDVKPSSKAYATEWE